MGFLMSNKEWLNLLEEIRIGVVTLERLWQFFDHIHAQPDQKPSSFPMKKIAIIMKEKISEITDLEARLNHGMNVLKYKIKREGERDD